MPRDRTHWSSYEAEVSLFFQHESVIRSASDNGVGGNPWEKVLEYRGVTYEQVVTVTSRLTVADTIMPFRGYVYDTELPCLREQGATVKQTLKSDVRPACSQVLRACYGTRVTDYRDSAPDGERLLREAQRAYVQAALRVIERRPDRKRQELAEEHSKDRLRAEVVNALRRLVGSNP